MTIRERLGKEIIISDGAMGTMLQKYGLETGGLPELLNFTHPDMIQRLYGDYFNAGSDFVSTNTFGSSEYKTAGCGYSVEEIICQAVSIARRAAEEAAVRTGKEKYVALSMGSIGRMMEPLGELSFEEAYQSYQKQILAAVTAKPDFVLFETITDINEMRAAVLAAKENCDLPVFCSLTFQEDGRMLMGSDPFTAVNILQDMGIDALGVNCSLGPVQMLPIVKEILACCKLPVLVQPNAGLPSVVNGETVFDVTISEYTEAVAEMIEAGASIVGGCCGTSPDYIRSLAEHVAGLDWDETRIKLADRIRNIPPVFAVSSSLKTVVLDDRIRVIGERINPTGKKLLKEALKSGDFGYIENEAIAQVKAGAEILDINVGLPEIDEKAAMLEAIRRVAAVTDVPLQIDSADPEVLEAAVRAYNGKAIINSVNGKQEVMAEVFPIVKKYGACVIALTLDERGLPKNAAERFEIAEKIIRTAETYGIGRERILTDCLTLTVSAQQDAALDTLEAIRRIKQEFGVKTTLGASNVSFGLPERKLLNRTFLSMALSAGLDAPITDPLAEGYIDTIKAFEVLSGKDVESRDYIAYQNCLKNERDGVSGKAAASGAAAGNREAQGAAKELTLEEIIINGYDSKAAAVTEKLLETMSPLEIVEKKIIPSLEIVGRDYETGESFLPQLIKSADTVKHAFAVLKAALSKSGQNINYGKVIVATVQGDIHDIGKNIAKVLLENYGYEVIDLGKDVPIGAVVERAKEEGIRLVGLSALMTTTVVNMEATIKELHKVLPDCKTAVGGAVLTAEYAAQIGADYYCKDAMATVKAAAEVFKK